MSSLSKTLRQTILEMKKSFGVAFKRDVPVHLRDKCRLQDMMPTLLLYIKSVRAILTRTIILGSR